MSGEMSGQGKPRKWIEIDRRRRGTNSLRVEYFWGDSLCEHRSDALMHHLQRVTQDLALFRSDFFFVLR